MNDNVFIINDLEGFPIVPNNFQITLLDLYEKQFKIGEDRKIGKTTMGAYEIGNIRIDVTYRNDETQIMFSGENQEETSELISKLKKDTDFKWHNGN